MGWHGHGESKGGLAGRFVPAGEGAARVEGLELRAGHNLGLAVNVRVGGTVEPGHLVVEKAREGDGQDNVGRIGRHGLVKDERDSRGLDVDMDLERGREANYRHASVAFGNALNRTSFAATAAVAPCLYSAEMKHSSLACNVTSLEVISVVSREI